MTTIVNLERTITRRTPVTVRGRPLIVEVRPDGLRFRLERKQEEFHMSWDQAFRAAYGYHASAVMQKEGVRFPQYKPPRTKRSRDGEV